MKNHNSHKGRCNDIIIFLKYCSCQLQLSTSCVSYRILAHFSKTCTHFGGENRVGASEHATTEKGDIFCISQGYAFFIRFFHAIICCLKATTIVEASAQHLQLLQYFLLSALIDLLGEKNSDFLSASHIKNDTLTYSRLFISQSVRKSS